MKYSNPSILLVLCKDEKYDECLSPDILIILPGFSFFLIKSAATKAGLLLYCNKIYIIIIYKLYNTIYRFKI